MTEALGFLLLALALAIVAAYLVHLIETTWRSSRPARRKRARTALGVSFIIAIVVVLLRIKDRVLELLL